MENSGEKLAALGHHRAILMRAINGLDMPTLDYRIFPESKSIGEMLFHIAGFEFIVVSSIQLDNGNPVDVDLWHTIKPGFAREGGFQTPNGFELDRYITALDCVRERTEAYIGENEGSAYSTRDHFLIDDLMKALSAADAECDPSCYTRLRTGVGTSYADDGPPPNQDVVDIVDLMQFHETYHRGQITIQKYLISRMNGRGFDKS